jgi:hypothetical protein
MRNQRAGITQSVKRLATGWTVRSSNPGGDEIFRIRPDRLWGPPTMATGSFPWVKRPDHDVDHTLHLAPRLKVKERVQLSLYSPSGPSWPTVNFTFTLSMRDQAVHRKHKHQQLRLEFITNLMHNFIYSIILLHDPHMFRASLCSSSGGQLYIYSIWYRPTLYAAIQSADQERTAGTARYELNFYTQVRLNFSF